MRDFSNLAWRETPFGADRRPFGNRAHMLAAVDIAWGPMPGAGKPVPRCVSVVYLRVHPARPLAIEATTLPVGFRATVLEDVHADLEEVLDVLDRALARARRHAFMLAGHQLDQHLSQLDHLSSARPRPGIDAVLDAWDGRDTKIRGMARLNDTADDPEAGRVDVDPDADPVAEPLPANTSAALGLARCLAIGLTAGRRSGLFRWDGTFATCEALAAAGWDLLDTSTEATL